MNASRFILAVTLAVMGRSLVAPCFGQETVSLAAAPPVVVSTFPVSGSTNVPAALNELRVTFSKAMKDHSWSWTTWREGNFPETNGQPHYLADHRTCVLPVKLEPGKFYATWLNSERFDSFKDAQGHSAVPYLLTFTTSPSTAEKSAAIPKPDDLPGQLVFHGRYRHRSRGRDISAPSELWVKKAADGSLSVLARLPFSHSSELALGNAQNQLTRYWIGGDSSGDWPGYRIDLELANGNVLLTRRGVREDCDNKLIKVPEGAWFDPNTRPDSYCAANILLRAFAVAPGEMKDFHVYDWDNRGEAFADYTIRVRHAGKERVQVPAGTFEANHLVLTQLTSADTWFKKRAGHVTDFWVLDNHVIVRVLRHREPYEMQLLDYTVPQKLQRKTNGRADAAQVEVSPESKPSLLRTAEPESGMEETLKVASRLREAAPLMDDIRDTWMALNQEVEQGNAADAVRLLRDLIGQVRRFHDRVEATPIAASVKGTLEQFESLKTTLEKPDMESARAMMRSLGEKGQRIEEQIQSIMAAASQAASVPGVTNAVVLHYDDGVETGVRSIAASGHAVAFVRPAAARYMEAVRIFASRYGTPEPPQEDFHLYIMNRQQQVIADVPFPYSLIERGDRKWYTLRTPSIEVPEEFTVALKFNPNRTKGIYLAYTGTNGLACHSLVGLPGEDFKPANNIEWMVRVSLTTEPTKAKGFQALADWKPPVESDPFAGCRFAVFGGEKSDGKQSYGGRGPAIQFRPAEFLPDLRAGEAVRLKGVRLYAGRYGSGYVPETAKLRVYVLDGQTNTLAQAEFAYAEFHYHERWVNLVFPKPIAIANPNDPILIAFDPDATRYKGIYFHYQQSPASSHSLAGKVGQSFAPVPEREWMVRAAFESEHSN